MTAALLVLSGVLLGTVAGWWARGRYSPCPDGWAVLCRDRLQAAMIWRNGTTIVRTDRYGIRYLSPTEISDALADRMRGLAPPEPPYDRRESDAEA